MTAEQQTGRDAAEAVIKKAITAPKMLDLGFNADDARLAAPHIADALASAGLLVATEPEADAVEVVARALHEERKRHLLCHDSWHTWHVHKPEARAVIASMPKLAVSREQVETMAAALHDRLEHGVLGEQRMFETRTATVRNRWIGAVAEELRTIGIPMQDGEG